MRFFNTLFFKLLLQNNRYLTLLINFKAFIMHFLFVSIHSKLFKSVLGEMLAFSKGTKRFF